MPGIVGIISANRSKEDKITHADMLRSMMHEHWYTTGSYSDDLLGIWVAWVNHENSFTDCMPVWNEKKDVCLIFSGEDFRDQSDIDHLRSIGHVFESENAGYLVHFYEEMGAGFLQKLNGRFSGLVIDLRNRKIILFNDRYGLGRIYYHENSKGFYFATEAKALLRALPGLREMNMRSLGEYFSVGCTLQNRTLFPGIHILPGGSGWTFLPGQVVQKSLYFQRKEWEEQSPLSAAEYYGKLKETWARILPRYFRGKDRLAISLTGGIDSRMIMAWIKHPAGNLPCYTFGGMFRECKDIRLARHVAEICAQPHQVIEVGRDFLSRFAALAEKTVYLTDGVMDVSGTPDLFVNGIARQVAPVRITGNYGQEILRSDIAFRPMGLTSRVFSPELQRSIEIAASTYQSEFAGNQLSFVAFKQLPWHHFSRLALELSQITTRTPYIDNDLVQLAFQTPPETAGSVNPQLRLISDGNPKVGSIGTDRGLLYRSAPVITTLHHLFQEFTFKAEYAYDYGMPQWLSELDCRLRRLHLERLFLGRHKFYHFRIWYRDELAGYVKEILLDTRSLSRPYLEHMRVEEIVKSHTSGRRNYTLELHRLLSLELCQRQLIESA